MGKCQPNTLQNTKHTIFWVKELSAVPEVHKDLLTSWYCLYIIYSIKLCSDPIVKHLICGAARRLHRHLG